MSEKRVKLKAIHNVISCACEEGAIHFDTTGKIEVRWDGKCNGCDRLEKCINSIRCIRNEMYSQAQK